MAEGTSGAGSVEGGESTGEISGRFAIDADRRAATVVPPTSPEAEEISLDTLEAVIEVAPAARKPVTVPPPVPPQARSHHSGMAPARSVAPRAATPVVEDEGLMDSLRPFYKELEAPAERAQVEVADLSLQLDNPYLASSLVPPARTPSATGRIVVGIAAVVALAAAGYFVSARESQQPVEVPVLVRPVASSVPATVAAPLPEPAVAVEEPAPAAEAAATATATATTEPAVEPVAVAAATPSAAPTARAPETVEPVSPKPVAPVAANPTDASAQVVPAAAASVVEAPTTAAPSAEVEPPAAAEPPVAVAAITPVAPVADSPAAPAATATDAVAVPTDLPTVPTREQVAAGFDALRPDLLQCAAGKTGVVVIDATLASTGRIAHALIDGDVFKGTPEGSCMARTVRKARFAPFGQATLKVRYPVQL